MNVKGLAWMGIRSANFEQTVAFFRDTMGLEVSRELEGLVELRFSELGEMEIFSPDNDDHDFFTLAPVVGFLVDDVSAARAEMEAVGVEFIGSMQSSGRNTWHHFRGPDGNIYELISHAPAN